MRPSGIILCFGERMGVLGISGQLMMVVHGTLKYLNSHPVSPDVQRRHLMLIVCTCRLTHFDEGINGWEYL